MMVVDGYHLIFEYKVNAGWIIVSQAACNFI